MPDHDTPGPNLKDHNAGCDEGMAETWPDTIGDGSHRDLAGDAPATDEAIRCSGDESCGNARPPVDPCRRWACLDGVCHLQPLADDTACDDGDACALGKRCLAGQCSAGMALDCPDDDTDPCTTAGCDPTSGCRKVPITGQPCDDANACTAGDQCLSGLCLGQPVLCDDGDPCTADTCDAAAGCQFHTAGALPCNDGNACTDEDLCVDGHCMGRASECDDGRACTLDACTFSGGCIHTQPAGLPCDDGDRCTIDDACYQGSCAPGAALDCDDANACTSDTCDPAAGCRHDLLSATACDDDDACTVADQCRGGACQGTTLPCQDADPCTADRCDPSVGCVFAPVAGPCDDGDECTEGDFCDAGACHPGRNPQCLAVRRVVLAGDSWSAGLIDPLRDAFDARGYEEVEISWQLTAKPGTKVADWVSDPALLTALFVSLDPDPPTDILFFTLTGNDYLAAAKGGLGLMGAWQWFFTMTLIQQDLRTFVELARAGRPQLKIVLIGYDYLEFDMIQALGTSFPGFNLVTFNLGLVDLSGRCRDVAQATPNMLYAHNLGVLQNTFGDHFHPPFLCPNPIGGCPEYGPGAAPHPGPAPDYNPFPGGFFTYPSPLDYIPDGIHPNYDGFRAIIENSLDQGPAAWIEGQ